MSQSVRVRTDESVSDPAASERDSVPIGAVSGGRGSLPKVGVFHRHACARALPGRGEEQQGGGVVEFDGPSHFLASGAPTGASLLKRRYLILLGHVLVSVPYWEWERCQGAGEREQYLRSKLDGCRPFKFSKIEPLDSD